jgi:hypothetical protein
MLMVKKYAETQAVSKSEMNFFQEIIVLLNAVLFAVPLIEIAPARCCSVAWWNDVEASLLGRAGDSYYRRSVHVYFRATSCDEHV